MTQKKLKTLTDRMTSLGLEDVPGDPYRTSANEMLAKILSEAKKVHRHSTSGIYSDEDLIMSHGAFVPVFQAYAGHSRESCGADICHDMRVSINETTYRTSDMIQVRHKSAAYGCHFQASIRHPGPTFAGSYRVEDGDREAAVERVALEIARLVATEEDVRGTADRIVASCRKANKSMIYLDMPFQMDETRTGEFRSVCLDVNQMVNLPFAVLTQQTRQGISNLVLAIEAAKKRHETPADEGLRGCRIVSVERGWNPRITTRYIIPPVVIEGGYGCGLDDPAHNLHSQRFVRLQDDDADVAERYGDGKRLFVTTFGSLRPTYFLDESEIPAGLEINSHNGGHVVKYKGRTCPIAGSGRSEVRESIFKAIATIDGIMEKVALKPVTMKALHLHVVDSMDEETRERLRRFLEDLQQAKATGERIETLRAKVDDVAIMVRPSKSFDPVFTIELGDSITLAGAVITFKKDVGIPDTIRQALKGKPIENLARHPLLVGAKIRQIRDVRNTGGSVYVAVDLDFGPDIEWREDLLLAA